MTLVFRFRVLAVASLALAAVLPLSAAQHRRAVGPLTEVTVTGIVLDSSTGQPVQGVEVVNGVLHSKATGADGKYTITLPAGRPTLLTANYFAFQPQTKTVTPAAGTTLDFSLTPNPAVTVKTVNGETYVLDYASSQFAYVIVFAGYVRDDHANLCKPGGTQWAPDKSEFKKITGPGTFVNYAPCCANAAVTSLNVEMKSGEKTQVYFNDSCFGNEPDFLGRERSTGMYRYFAFKDVASVEFP